MISAAMLVVSSTLVLFCSFDSREAQNARMSVTQRQSTSAICMESYTTSNCRYSCWSFIVQWSSSWYTREPGYGWPDFRMQRFRSTCMRRRKARVLLLTKPLVKSSNCVPTPAEKKRDNFQWHQPISLSRRGWSPASQQKHQSCLVTTNSQMVEPRSSWRKTPSSNPVACIIIFILAFKCSKGNRNSRICSHGLVTIHQSQKTKLADSCTQSTYQ